MPLFLLESADTVGFSSVSRMPRLLRISPDQRSTLDLVAEQVGVEALMGPVEAEPKDSLFGNLQGLLEEGVEGTATA